MASRSLASRPCTTKTVFSLVFGIFAALPLRRTARGGGATAGAAFTATGTWFGMPRSSAWSSALAYFWILMPLSPASSSAPMCRRTRFLFALCWMRA